MKKAVLLVLLRITSFFGYLFLFISWAWVAVFYMPLLLRVLNKTTCLQPTPASPPANIPVTVPMPESVSFGIIVLTVLIVALVTGLALWRLPRSIMKTGDAITHKSADVIVPILHRSSTPLKPAEKKKLTAKALMLIKLMLCVLPVIMTLPLYWIDVSLPNGVALSFELMLLLVTLSAMGALLLFAVQAGISKAAKPHSGTLE